MADEDVPVGKLILWPAVVTLGVTLLRLVGELLEWSPSLFNRSAGGGGALVGISWLPLLFGIVFAVQLVRRGARPSSGMKAVGSALAAVVAVVVLMMAAGAAGLVSKGSFSITGLLVMTTALFVGAGIAASGWPALGKTLLAYAFAARIPVVVLMLIAMIGDWKTHYDVAPPGFPEMGLLSKWLLIGLLPQLTTWIAITVLSGALTGAVAGALAGRGQQSGDARAAA